MSAQRRYEIPFLDNRKLWMKDLKLKQKQFVIKPIKQ